MLSAHGFFACFFTAAFFIPSIFVDSCCTAPLRGAFDCNASILIESLFIISAFMASCFIDVFCMASCDIAALELVVEASCADTGVTANPQIVTATSSEAKRAFIEHILERK